MNILYLSNLSGLLWNGPNNSIPAQIHAQSKIDNVFWFNYNQAKRKEWNDNLDCKNLQDIPNPHLSKFPIPFNTPDIVVVEEFYEFPFNKLIKEIQKKHIPYVIIPRSQMTVLAQHHKYFKKKIANFFYFNNLVKKASAIEYLTENEKKESISQWKKENFIIPNGIDLPHSCERNFSTNGNINASYIGRIDVYQKGLDLLLDSLSEIKDKLLEKKFFITFYGPSKEKDLDVLKKKVIKLKIESLVCFENAVFGEKKQEILLNTDVFVMTSRFEGLPMGLIEALAYGTPCIVTNGTNMSIEIAKADAGWTAENNKESIKSALLRMIVENDFSKKGRNAFELAKKYSWVKIAQKTHDIYEKIIKNDFV